MKEPTPVREIPGTVTAVDLATGRETTKPLLWKVKPPPPDCCQFCGYKHEPHLPHNATSLYYKIVFNGVIGRPPTWADAAAHCGEAMRNAWTEELKRRGEWSEPPTGEKPISHHGVEA